MDRGLIVVVVDGLFGGDLPRRFGKIDCVGLFPGIVAETTFQAMRLRLGLHETLLNRFGSLRDTIYCITATSVISHSHL
jgi:hypothetical protein